MSAEVQMMKSGGAKIFIDGELRGSFKDPRTMATHLAFMVEEMDRLRRAINDMNDQAREVRITGVRALGGRFELVPITPT